MTRKFVQRIIVKGFNLHGSTEMTVVGESGVGNTFQLSQVRHGSGQEVPIKEGSQLEFFDDGSIVHFAPGQF